MSASREKKKRLDQTETATGSKQPEKKGLGKTGKTVIGIVIAAVLIAVVVFFGMINTGFFEKHTTAAIVNGHKLSPAMMNIYYSNAYQQVQQTVAYLGDPEKPLDEQAYLTDEFETWADFTMDSAMATANAAYSVYDEAMKNGFELSETSKTAIKNEIDSLDPAAMMNGYPSGDALLTAIYGKGTNKAVYEEFMNVSYVAQDYMASIADGMTYTHEDLDAYYTENSDQFDGVNYRTFSIAAEKTTDEEGNSTVSEEALKAAEETAKAAAEAAKASEEAYLEQAAAATTQEDYDADIATLVEDRPMSSLSKEIRDWMKEDGRTEGDVACLPNGTEDGFSVVYYMGKADHSYLLPTVRHILVAFPENADDAAKAEAKTKAEAILNDFKNGDGTEDAFAAMATEKSEDPGSAANGGLIEDIIKNSMVPEFDAWCFDAARKPGDTAIVETQYGYHVMYFVELGESFHYYALEQTMRNEDFTEWRDGIVSPDTYELVSDKHVTTR